MKLHLRWTTGIFLLTTVLSASAIAEEAGRREVQRGLAPLVRILNGQQTEFTLTGKLQLPIDGRRQAIRLHLARAGQNQFDLQLEHSEYAIEIYRRTNSTTVYLPKHGTRFEAKGTVRTADSLSPTGLLSRLISPYSEAQPVAAMLNAVQAEAIEPLIGLLQKPLQLKQRDSDRRWVLTDSSPLQFPADGQLRYTSDAGSVHLTISDEVALSETRPVADSVVRLSRSELERTFSRGVHRASEILAPGIGLRKPDQQDRQVPHGELRWIQNQRVALLHGTPEQIGTAHGKLLRSEATRCIESVLYTFATAHVIRTGRWFRHDLDQAYARLEPHIPARHKRETEALAAALDLPTETLEVLNVFPELFHCSGFALFNSATTDGKLYHGRVLDYMTTIGLQDAATTFIVRPVDHHAFANVGYASFVGSVSGMNDQAISLGEMGGKGEGQWDGVPMATLMRRALEECSSLQQVQRLWRTSPRTCEYYYVFADGKTNDAVGVAAWPDRIEFIRPGEPHDRLGDGIDDAVVLSAGSRLTELRKRVQQKHGQIDEETALWLMSQPVAMQSNLHNVLFVPSDGVLHVANASHRKPAAEMPYMKLNLRTLLDSMPVSDQPIRQTAAGE